MYMYVCVYIYIYIHIHTQRGREQQIQQPKLTAPKETTGSQRGSLRSLPGPDPGPLSPARPRFRRARDAPKSPHTKILDFRGFD